MRKWLLLLVLFVSVAVLPGLAQTLPHRQLPNGERGQLEEPQALPYVKIGGKVLRLAPGGVIYDQQNRSIVHANLPVSAPVLYMKDANGDIRRIYVLTEEERVRIDSAPRPKP